MFITIIFAAVLLVISLVMLATHYNAWRAADHGGLADRERQFQQRRFRRRTYASGSIGLVGALLISGLWVPEESVVNFCYTCGILLLVMGIILLAITDMLATRLHFERQDIIQSAQIAALQAALQRELKKQAESTGESPNESK